MSEPRGPLVLRAAIDAAIHREKLVADLWAFGVIANPEWPIALLEDAAARARRGRPVEIQPMGMGMTVRDELARLGAELMPVMTDCFAGICRFVYGPKAPARRRPRRIAKKLAKRGGRLRHPAAGWRRA